MGKGEIARHEQFLLFPQCFQKACIPGASKGVIVWEWVKTVSTYVFRDGQPQWGSGKDIVNRVLMSGYNHKNKMINKTLHEVIKAS